MAVRLTCTIAALLCCILFGAPLAQAKGLTPIEMHQKIEKAGIGTCITIKELDGTEFKGQILALGPDSFTLQPLATDGTIVLLYDDLVNVKTPSYKPLWITLGITVGLFATSAILMHNAWENGLNDMKTSQDKFCEANHIPLNECAGG